MSAPKAMPKIPIGVCIPVAFLRSLSDRNLSGKSPAKFTQKMEEKVSYMHNVKTNQPKRIQAPDTGS